MADGAQANGGPKNENSRWESNSLAFYDTNYCRLHNCVAINMKLITYSLVNVTSLELFSYKQKLLYKQYKFTHHYFADPPKTTAVHYQ